MNKIEELKISKKDNATMIELDANYSVLKISAEFEFSK